MSHIAGCENAGNIRFKVIRLPIKSPVGRALAIPHQIGSGDKVAAFIAQNADFRSPLGMRHTAQAQKEPASRYDPFPLASGYREV